MATNYISPWGGMPRTGTDPLYGYSSVPQEVQDNFANYMSSGGMNIAYQDPETGLYWQAQNTLGDGAGQPGNMYGGYRVYQPSWDGGFDVGSGYDLFTPDGAYGGSEGFLKPSAQRTWNMGLASVLGAAAAGAMGAAGSQAGTAGGTAAAEGAGTAGLSAADLASMEMGMSVPAGADAVAAYGGLASPSLEAMAGAMGMTPEAFAALGSAGVGGAGAAAGMTAGTAAGSGAGAAGGSLIPGISNSQLLGAGVSTLGGVASGSGAGAGGAGGGGGLDPRLEPYIYGSGGLLPQAQGLLGSQMPLAQQQSAQLASTGGGLLGQPISGNGVGQVPLGQSNVPNDPYLSGVAGDISRRTQELLAQNNNAIAGRQVSAGGLGSTRMGVAQGVAAGQAADSLQGQLANLYSSAWNQDANRNLQKYQTDTNFYDSQRRTDLAGTQLGGGLLSQSQQQAFAPLAQANDIYKPYSNLNSAAGSSDNKWLTGLSTGMGIYGTGMNAGWWK